MRDEPSNNDSGRLEAGLLVTGKLVVAGGVIAVIWLGMLVLQPEPEAPIANAEADISMFDFAPRTDQQKFVEALMEEGLEEPRAYDHNGNKLFFSTTTTEETPREVMARLQHAFVDYGLNEHAHESVPMRTPSPELIERVRNHDREALQRLEKMKKPHEDWLNDYYGGIVPLNISQDAVYMAGATTKAGDDKFLDYAESLVEAHKKGEFTGLEDSVAAMRYVDAVNEGSKTRVTAVWSDDDYDLKKLANIAEPGDDLGVDPTVPVCPGCERLMHFKADTELGYDNHAFRAPSHSVDQTMGFYARALDARGWRVSDANLVMQNAEDMGLKPRADAAMLNFAREGNFMVVMAWPDDDGSTAVHVARSN